MKTSTRKLWHQIICVIPVAFNQLVIGFGYGWLAPTLKSLQDPDSVLPLSTTEASWIASLHALGRAFGPLITGSLIDVLGRKFIMTMGSVVISVPWLGVVFFKSIPVLYLARFIFGVGDGMCDSLSALYIAENCSPKIRGVLSTGTIVFYFVALVIQYVLAMYLSYEDIGLVNLITCGIGIPCTLLITETTQFLLMRNEKEKAIKTFKWLQGDDNLDHLKSKFEQIKKNVKEEKRLQKSLKTQLANSYNRRCILIAFVLHVLESATGGGVLLVYVTTIIPDFKSFSSYDFTIAFGVIELFSTIVSLFIIDIFDRRTLLKTSFFLIGVITSGIGLIYTFYQEDRLEWYSLVIFAGIGGLAFMISIVGPTLTILRGELFPQSVRAIGCALCVMGNAATSFCILKVFLLISECFGIQYNFFIYSAVSFITVIFICCLLPESRAKTLVDIHTKCTVKNDANVIGENKS